MNSEQVYKNKIEIARSNFALITAHILLLNNSKNYLEHKISMQMYLKREEGERKGDNKPRKTAFSIK